MKKFRFTELKDNAGDHLLSSVLPGKYIYTGGIGFSKPGSRSHTHDGPDKKDYHVHKDCEAFIILQGKGFVEIDKVLSPVAMGDIVIAEPGEDHHLISDENDPIVVAWLHAGPEKHVNQQ